ncbi:peptidase, M48 family [Leptospira ryugenii]|uniref:Peptidase, M48 family n=1 Tax=Leptospira ryugenii TaxID=1917863 RepID=A0A2P2E4P6_9LEPT|nr:M48 family metalloprotease [Leptospira ryugenii]GBF51860.1 peptidase, M48 family [Leptospira ryugenii]
MRKLLLLSLFIFSVVNVYSKGALYVQNPKAKLLAEPQMNAEGSLLPLGEKLTPITEQGLFVQVRTNEKTGWVSKLFVSPLPPSSQIQLGSKSQSVEAVVARQRASDFTKTAAARGLSETEKMRVRGGADLYDFESLRWLESLGTESKVDTNQTNGTSSTAFAKPEERKVGSVSEETKAEVKVGRSLAARLLRKYPLWKNKDFTVYLGQVGKQIASNSSRPELSFTFGVLDTEEVNAFACPGGFILITKGALKNIRSESELAGVLGHEIGHVALFHSGEFIQNNVYLDIISSLLSPPGAEVVNQTTANLLDEMEKQLFESGRDSQAEYEADEAGVVYAGSTGYGVAGLSNYLISLSKLDKADTLKKTHPDTSSRIAKLVKAEATAQIKNVPSPKERWYRYKAFLN